jgi:uncharacterized protein YdbL (DUF1318 family)
MKKHRATAILKHAPSVIALILALLLPAAVYALSVGEAKRAGLVTETRNGYLRAVPAKRTPQVDRLVSQTNAARKAKYREIAKKLKVDLGTVERDFGAKLGGH